MLLTLSVLKLNNIYRTQDNLGPYLMHIAFMA